MKKNDQLNGVWCGGGGLKSVRDDAVTIATFFMRTLMGNEKMMPSSLSSLEKTCSIFSSY